MGILWLMMNCWLIQDPVYSLSMCAYVSVQELLSSLITVTRSVNCFSLFPLTKQIGSFKVPTATSTSSALSWHMNSTSSSVISSLLFSHTKKSNTGHTWLLESSLILLTTQELKKGTNRSCQHVFDFMGFDDSAKDLEE